MPPAARALPWTRQGPTACDPKRASGGKSRVEQRWPAHPFGMDRPSLFHAAGVNSQEDPRSFLYVLPSHAIPALPLVSPAMGGSVVAPVASACGRAKPGGSGVFDRSQLFRQQVDDTGVRRGRPDHTSSKAVFAYFWPLWPKSKSRRRSEILTQLPIPPKAASLSLPFLFLSLSSFR